MEKMKKMKVFGERSISSFLYKTAIVAFVIVILGVLFALDEALRGEVIKTYEYKGIVFELIKEKALSKGVTFGNFLLYLISAVYSFLFIKLFYNLKNLEIFTEKNFKLVKYYSLVAFVEILLTGLISKFELDFLKGNIVGNVEIDLIGYGEVFTIYGLTAILTALTIVLIGYGIKRGLEYKEENELTI